MKLTRFVQAAISGAVAVGSVSIADAAATVSGTVSAGSSLGWTYGPLVQADDYGGEPYAFAWGVETSGDGRGGAQFSAFADDGAIKLFGEAASSHYITADTAISGGAGYHANANYADSLSIQVDPSYYGRQLVVNSKMYIDGYVDSLAWTHPDGAGSAASASFRFVVLDDAGIALSLGLDNGVIVTDVPVQIWDSSYLLTHSGMEGLPSTLYYEFELWGVAGQAINLGVYGEVAGSSSGDARSAAYFGSSMYWAGIEDVLVDGVSVPFSVTSASGFDYRSPHPALLASVPEPATLALLGIGLAGLGFSRRISGSGNTARSRHAV